MLGLRKKCTDISCYMFFSQKIVADIKIIVYLCKL